MPPVKFIPVALATVAPLVESLMTKSLLLPVTEKVALDLSPTIVLFLKALTLAMVTLSVVVIKILLVESNVSAEEMVFK